MFRRKWLLVVIVLLVIGGGASAFFARRGDPGVSVTAENIQKRDLEAIVSASGKIDPKKTVNISAQTPGRVTRLGVKEGDHVKAGQFLIQIDPVNAEAAVRWTTRNTWPGPGRTTRQDSIISKAPFAEWVSRLFPPTPISCSFTSATVGAFLRSCRNLESSPVRWESTSCPSGSASLWEPRPGTRVCSAH